MYKSWILLSLFPILVYSQETTELKEYNSFTNEVKMDEFDLLFGVSQRDTEKKSQHTFNTTPFANFSYLLDETWAKDHLLEQLMLRSDSDSEFQLRLNLSQSYLEDDQFKLALQVLREIDPNQVAEDYSENYFFQLGYLGLINKDFDYAEDNLDRCIEHMGTMTKYATYYKGVCAFFQQDYEEASEQFVSVGNFPEYRDHIPYYLTQIYFSEGDYDTVIQYGKEELGNPNLENRFEIEKLIAQSFYNKGDYRNALFHFKRYEQNTDKLSKEEFFQIASIYYEIGEYTQSIELFTEIANQNNELGVMANYYLANAYILTGDKNSAMSANQNIISLSKNPTTLSAARFNYAKLSYELGNDRQAINSLLEIKETDPNHAEAQKVLSEILVRSDDYEFAIKTIDKVQFKSELLHNTYQKLNFKVGIQALNDQNYNKASTHFIAAKKLSHDFNIKTESLYWLGYIENKQGNSKTSSTYLDEYFRQKPSENTKAFFAASYLYGYLNFKEERFTNALYHFEKAERSYQTDRDRKDILSDVHTRIGDCSFQNNDYLNAISSYEKTIKYDSPDAPYAIYQIATIQNIQADHYSSIVEFEELAERYPESMYRDLAYYHAGRQYQKLHKPAEALNSFKKIISPPKEGSELLVPSFIQAALICYNKGDYKNAVQYYSKVFEYGGQGSEKNEALSALKEIYLEDINDPSGYFEFVEEKADVKLGDFERDSLSYYYAINKFKNGEYREAINGFDEYEKTYSKGYFLKESVYYRGESFSILQDYDSALQDFEYFIDYPKHSFYPEAIKKAGLIAYNHKEDYQKSSNYFAKTLDISLDEKDKKEICLAYIISLFKTEQYQPLVAEGINYTNMSGISFQDKARAHYFIGKSYLQLNDKEQALHHFEEVATHSSNNQSAEANYHVASILHDNDEWDLALDQALATTKKAKNYPQWVAKSLLLASNIYIKKDDLLNAKAAALAVQENYKDNSETQQEVEEILSRIELLEKTNSRIKETLPEDVLEMDQKEINKK